MPATCFQCPDGQTTAIPSCLDRCRLNNRCLFLPTLRATAQSLNREINGFTITELLCGTREAYLKKTTDYAVNPLDRTFALHGSAVHVVNSDHADSLLAEKRLYAEHASGCFDLYGDILGDGIPTVGDYKVTSSYKVMQALGLYSVDVATGETYKTGMKKGLPKTRKEWRQDGARLGLQDWRIQQNYYRMLLESAGYPVERMLIQAIVRDASVATARTRNIDKPVYIIPINRIQDTWLKRYVRAKARRLEKALEQKRLPAICSARERWNDRKCSGYCDVAGHCDYGLALQPGLTAEAG